MLLAREILLADADVLIDYAVSDLSTITPQRVEAGDHSVKYFSTGP